MVGLGADLNGNTFWEFKDSFGANRFRRIAQAHDPRVPYADLKISRMPGLLKFSLDMYCVLEYVLTFAPAQWHQWLRHTRFDPPSMIEQQSDVQRQVQLKQLARLADERWAAKPSLLDAPTQTSKYEPATIPRDKGGYVGQTESNGKEGVRNHVASASAISSRQAPEQIQKKEKLNPWRIDRGSPGEEWQPKAWTPSSPGKQ